MDKIRDSDTLEVILADKVKTEVFREFLQRELRVSERARYRVLRYLDIAYALCTLYALPDDAPLIEARELFLSIKMPLLQCTSGILPSEVNMQLMEDYIQVVEKDFCMSPNLKLTEPLYSCLKRKLSHARNSLKCHVNTNVQVVSEKDS